MSITCAKPNWNRAKQVAERVLQDNCLEEPPINAKELAERNGLTVSFVNFNRLGPEYSDIAGFINKNNVYVNADDTPARQNFTIAHELGHILLEHDNYDILYRRDLENQSNKTVEQEANYFAANLLVPEKMFKSFIKEYPYASNKQLSDIFGVSKITIEHRRNRLGV